LDELRQICDCIIDVESTYDTMIYVHDQDCYAEEVEKLEAWIKKIGSDVEVVRCHFLCSDGTWHYPHIRIYLTEDPVGLLWVSDYAPSWDDRGAWEETLIEWMGAKHPDRVMDALMDYLEDNPDYEMEIQGLKIHPEKEYIIVDLCNDTSIITHCFENYEVLEVVSEEYDHTEQFVDYYTVIARNSEGEEVRIEKEVSRWQGSADYTARFSEE